MAYKHVISELTFKCKLCDMMFSRRNDYNHHKLTQYQKGRVSCHICHKTYKNKKNAREHIKKVHDSKETFACVYCEKEFCI